MKADLLRQLRKDSLHPRGVAARVDSPDLLTLLEERAELLKIAQMAIEADDADDLRRFEDVVDLARSVVEKCEPTDDEDDDTPVTREELLKWLTAMPAGTAVYADDLDSSGRVMLGASNGMTYCITGKP